MYLKKIKAIILKNSTLFKRYIVISLISYGFVFSSLYLLIDIFHINKTLAFIITYGIAYIFLYKVQLTHLFKTAHDSYKLIRFCVALLFFYICANLLYNLGLYLGFHYLVSTILTSAILMPLRFIVFKIFVYKANHQ